MDHVLPFRPKENNQGGLVEHTQPTFSTCYARKKDGKPFKYKFLPTRQFLNVSLLSSIDR